MIKYFAILILFFCAMPDISFAACVATMQDCPESYYNKYGCSVPGTLHPVTGYSCESCSTLTSDGVFLNSVGGYIESDSCFASRICQTNFNCRLFYNGTTDCYQNVVPRPYHLENVNGTIQCVSNSETKNCSDFDLDGQHPLMIVGQQFFNKSEQTGSASWGDNTYNVEQCLLQRHNMSINSRKCTGSIWRGNAQITGSAATGFKIKYGDTAGYYCTKCPQGEKPLFFNDVGVAWDFGCAYTDHATSNYLACKCEDVEENFYSTGCSLPDYPLGSNAIPDSCHISCPERTTTNGVTGALSESLCVPDGTEYCDSVGCFKLNPVGSCNGE